MISLARRMVSRSGAGSLSIPDERQVPGRADAILAACRLGKIRMRAGDEAQLQWAKLKGRMSQKG